MVKKHCPKRLAHFEKQRAASSMQYVIAEDEVSGETIAAFVRYDPRGNLDGGCAMVHAGNVALWVKCGVCKYHRPRAAIQ